MNHQPNPQPLTQQQLAEAKRDCGALLNTLGHKPSTHTGRAIIRAYWLGLLRGANDPDFVINPAITILILGCRWHELAGVEVQQ
jgi:hypothetical protein